MKLSYTLLAGLVMAASLASLTVGCAAHVYRANDTWYGDVHTWDADEDRYYHSWYVEVYPNRPYREYKRLDNDDQHRYWDWRHKGGHGKGHEHHEHDDDHR